MIKKSIGAVSFVVLIAGGQQVLAAPVEYVMRGQITEGFTPGETSGEFVPHIGDTVEFQFTLEIDIANSTGTHLNSDGITVYEFKAVQYFGNSHYDVGGIFQSVGVDGQVSETSVNTAFDQDVAFNDFELNGTVLNGNYDILELIFETFDTANNTGYENNVFIIGDSDWLTLGVMPDLSQAIGMIGQIGSFTYDESGFVGFQDFARIDVQSFETSAVPVPAAAWLFMSGLAGVFYTKRSNKFTE